MKLYQEESKCDKCGYRLKIEVTFVKGSEANETYNREATTDVMQRECARCGYVWYERPLEVDVGEIKCTCNHSVLAGFHDANCPKFKE